MSQCVQCGEKMSEGDAHWYDGEMYCESCFYDSYVYCSRCDEAISRENCTYNDNGDPVCDDCYDNDIDENAPVNPDVSDSEREQIITLCKCWLKGEKAKTLIRINRGDLLLEEIQSRVGLVDHPIYLYGLSDRAEYQIKASSDILELVKSQVLELGLEAVVSEDIGHNRLAISKTLRRENLNGVVELIKRTTIKEKVQLCVE